MKRALIALVIIIGGCVLIHLMVLNSPGLPPLRTWQLGSTPTGSNQLEVSFRTPERDCQPSYWSYNIGLVLPVEQEFDLRGRVVVSSAGKRKSTTLEFDPEAVTKSSWLQDKMRVSYLLHDDLGMKDEEDYQLEIHFDKPLPTEVAVVLHFLSHTDPKQSSEIGQAPRAPRSGRGILNGWLTRVPSGHPSLSPSIPLGPKR